MMTVSHPQSQGYRHHLNPRRTLRSHCHRLCRLELRRCHRHCPRHRLFRHCHHRHPPHQGCHRCLGHHPQGRHRHHLQCHRRQSLLDFRPIRREFRHCHRQGRQHHLFHRCHHQGPLRQGCRHYRHLGQDGQSRRHCQSQDLQLVTAVQRRLHLLQELLQDPWRS